jgi:hypothetical protein
VPDPFGFQFRPQRYQPSEKVVFVHPANVTASRQVFQIVHASHAACLTIRSKMAARERIFGYHRDPDS